MNGAAATGPCFTISASDVIIKGLVINNCDVGVSFTSGVFDTSKVEGCFLGTDAAGTARVDQNPNKQIEISGQSGAVIGGCGSRGAQPDRRLFFRRPHPQHRLADGAQIQGNLIGLTAAGNAALAPVRAAPRRPASRSTATDHVIEDNAIAGLGKGIVLAGTDHAVRGNRIGTERRRARPSSASRTRASSRAAAT